MFSKRSSVINSIYSGQQQFSLIAYYKKSVNYDGKSFIGLAPEQRKMATGFFWLRLIYKNFLVGTWKWDEEKN